MAVDFKHSFLLTPCTSWVSGGIQSVTLRYGDDPARPMRLASKLEKYGRMILLENEEFRSAVQSTRLRIKFPTLVSAVKDFDLDTSDIDEVINHINNSCPIVKKTLPKRAFQRAMENHQILLIFALRR